MVQRFKSDSGPEIRRKFSISFMVLLFLLPSGSFCQDTEASKKKADADTLVSRYSLFDSEEILDITLQFDLTTFLKKADKAGAYDGNMIIYPGERDSIMYKVVIKHRGQYRFDNCVFPPIQLNLRQPVYAYSDTGKIKKLKLVTHCQPGNMTDEYILREYLIYKLYNVLTDTSFRARLLRVTYLDSKKSRKPIKQYGIFIEPLPILASRINSVVVKTPNLTMKNIFPEVINRIAIFNFMVANWDWAVQSQHNIAVVKSLRYDPSGLVVGIPFDFDLSGVVNTDYNVPAENTGLTTNRDRKFTGMCRTKEEYRAALQEFIVNKDKFRAVINDFPYMEARGKKDIVNFINQFLDRLDKEKDIDYLINNLLLNTCIKL